MLSILTLLIGFGIMLNPSVCNVAYAEDGTSGAGSDAGISTMSLDPDKETISISFDSAPGDSEINLSQQAQVDQVAYITTNFTVTSKQTKKYIVALNAMNGSTGNLVGKDNPYATIEGVGTNVAPDNFASNTWGYHIGNKNDTSYNETTTTYSSVPAYGEYIDVATQEIDKPTEEEVQDHYKLSFAAKIGSDSPSDHYQTKLYLSVVRTAGRTYTVTYNGNKPSGATTEPSSVPGTQTFIETTSSSNFNLTTQEPTLTGYNFLGWSTSSSATTAEYTAGQNFTVTSDTLNNIDLYAVWQQKTYTLTFDGNKPAAAVNNPTGVPDNISQPGNNAFTIPSTTPALAGYTFLGWNTDKSATTASLTAGNSYTIPDDNENTTLYAIWKASITLNGITTMQQMTKDVCAATTTGASKQLTDARDNKSYYVTKLKDGNCWMTQNLAYNGGGTNTYGDTTSMTSKACTSAWGDDNGAKQYCTSSTGSGHGAYGNYYSWMAAVNSDTSGTATSQIRGVCPRGWHLPTSNTTTDQGSFGYLLAQYGIDNNTAGSNTLRADPLYFVYAGYVGYDGLGRTDSYGNYWSSTPNGSVGAYNLYFHSGGVNPSDYYYHYSGYSVRCLADF